VHCAKSDSLGRGLSADPLRLPVSPLQVDWPSKLSLGEQQRLAFARVLLAKPKLVRAPR
jgi:ABC-type uncharacterized transport system fused permease/ATPase subunit